MKTFVGIDASYTGLAIVAFDNDDYEVHRLKAFDKKHFGDGIGRLLDIETWVYATLDEIVRAQGVEHVCLEGYASASKYGREQAGELGATVKMACHKVLPYPTRFPTIVQPSALKKFVIGSGRGDKNLVLLNVYKRWGAEFNDDNLADAYGLARIAQALCFEPTDLPKYQQEVIRALKPHTEMRH